ncbi:Lrp/AsnC family transcriptional regulator [Cardinium endosymbiont of Tipula unca]|uniref:Lrp/AsnC family transcriptional regulator n=1 Tax=Cardinium endosymbiont of Tipula unca TaxID=3066216 RepID=UPI0030D0FF63
MELDKTDKHILNILQVDAKITNAALAQKINLSPAATLERVRKLEQYEIVINYHAKIDYVKLGFFSEIIAGVQLNRATSENIKLLKTTIDKITLITTCYQVVGGFDFILMVKSKDMNSYQHMVIEKLYMLDIIKDIQTLSVTQLLKNKPITFE